MPEKTAIDSTAPVREGEQLNIAALEPYLRDNIPGITGTMSVEQFPGGHSNLTYLIRFGAQEFVLRRPPYGSKVKAAHDMGREYKVLSKLWPYYAPAPRPYVMCEDESILGAPFYVMERRTGVVVRNDFPATFDASPAGVRKTSFALIKNLATLHAVDYTAAGLADLGRPVGFVRRQVEGWAKRHADAITEPIPDIDWLRDWLMERIPAETGAAIVHNDYKYDNCMFDANDQTRIVAVFDWEMTTLGDPLVDLGVFLGYWFQPEDEGEMEVVRQGPTAMPGSPTRQEMADHYGEIARCDVSNMLFYVAYALFKNAVVVEQIYYRYHHGLTSDKRFAKLNEAAKSMAALAVKKAKDGRI